MFFYDKLSMTCDKVTSFAKSITAFRLTYKCACVWDSFSIRLGIARRGKGMLVTLGENKWGHTTLEYILGCTNKQPLQSKCPYEACPNCLVGAGIVHASMIVLYDED